MDETEQRSAPETDQPSVTTEWKAKVPEEVQKQYEDLCRQLPIDCGEFKIDKIHCALTNIPQKDLFPRFGLSIAMADGSQGGTVMLELGLERIETIYFAYTPGISYENDQEVISKVKAYFSTQASISFVHRIYTLALAITRHELDRREKEYAGKQEAHPPQPAGSNSIWAKIAKILMS